MKRLDLGPNDYRRRGKDGSWQVPDDPKLARAMFFVAVGILAVIFFNLNTLSVFPVFVGTAVFAFCAGGLFAIWLKDVY